MRSRKKEWNQGTNQARSTKEHREPEGKRKTSSEIHKEKEKECSQQTEQMKFTNEDVKSNKEMRAVTKSATNVLSRRNLQSKAENPREKQEKINVLQKLDDLQRRSQMIYKRRQETQEKTQKTLERQQEMNVLKNLDEKIFYTHLSTRLD